MVIHIEVLNPSLAAPQPLALSDSLLDNYHSHATLATFEIAGGHQGDPQLYSLRPLAQKVMINGVAYLLKEIYGIEQKEDAGEAQDEDDSSECVVCMSDARDTLVLPCRHLCLCNPCAEVLRYQVCGATQPMQKHTFVV